MKAEDFIKELNMESHPEGGYYVRSFAADEMLTDRPIQERFDGDRHLWTSIYFLLREGEVSHFHQLKSDELWYFHAGSPLSIYMLHPETGELQVVKLGLDVTKGQRPQVLVPKGMIFGSALDEEGFSLVGCMVAPGFDFEDFKLFERQELLEPFPQHKEIIEKLTY